MLDASSFDKAGGVAVSRKPTTTSVGLRMCLDLGAQIEPGQGAAGGREMSGIGAQQGGPALGGDFGMGLEKILREHAGERDLDDRLHAALFDALGHHGEGGLAGVGNGGAGIDQHQLAELAAMAHRQRHRDETAEAVAEHFGLGTDPEARKMRRDAVGEILEPRPGRIRAAETGKIHQRHAPFARETRRDAVESGAVRKQGMKQDEAASLAHLLDVEFRAAVHHRSRSLLIRGEPPATWLVVKSPSTMGQSSPLASPMAFARQFV